MSNEREAFDVWYESEKMEYWLMCADKEMCFGIWQAARQSAGATGQAPVGVAGTMPGTGDGFTMACFKASDVPLGTKLYAAPIGDNGTKECCQCKGCGDNDAAPGHCVRCNGTGVEPTSQPAERKRAELSAQDIISAWREAGFAEWDFRSEHYDFARALLARAAAKGE
jgi:hypothetical protein